MAVKDHVTAGIGPRLGVDHSAMGCRLMVAVSLEIESPRALPMDRFVDVGADMGLGRLCAWCVGWGCFPGTGCGVVLAAVGAAAPG